MLAVSGSYVADYKRRSNVIVVSRFNEPVAVISDARVQLDNRDLKSFLSVWLDNQKRIA